MTTGAKIFLLFILFSWTSGFSQHLSHQVMVPAAGISITGTLNYTQSVGETAIEIMSGAGYVFTQGFQQPGIKLSPEITEKGNGVNVYPNPATDLINIKFYGDAPRKLIIEIINLAGMILHAETIVFIEKFHYVKQIDVDKLKSGFYFVRIISDDGLVKRTFKIEKM